MTSCYFECAIIRYDWKTLSYSHTEFAKLLDETIDELKKLSSLKGAEYAGDMDRLANFRRNAITLNLIPEQIWAVYAAKHWDAVMQYVSDTAAGIQRKRLEGIEGRLDDLIVYCILMKAMTKERNSYESGK